MFYAPVVSDSREPFGLECPHVGTIKVSSIISVSAHFFLFVIFYLSILFASLRNGGSD
jgi:hypothetical protein